MERGSRQPEIKNSSHAQLFTPKIFQQLLVQKAIK